MTAYQIIARLAPGRSAVLSATEAGRVEVERSSDGKSLAFIRYTPTGWHVFHRATF